MIKCLMLLVMMLAGATTLAADAYLPLPACAAAVSPDGWEWQNPLPQGNELAGVWGSSSSDVFAVGSGGTILRYDGSMWSSLSSGTSYELNDVWGTSSSDVFAVGVTAPSSTVTTMANQHQR